jgi:hypothetical protein
MLQALAQLLGSTHKTSGTLNDRNGLPTLTWTYSPSAAS